MSLNENMQIAKQNKNDEFYTLYEDIEEEMKYYSNYFEDKVIYCNCDDYRKSNFVKYFIDNFEKLKIKKLIATCYDESKTYTLFFDENTESNAMYFEKSKLGENVKHLENNGDFRSSECLYILKQCDIVITNPPFSLADKWFKTIIEYDKDFIFIGSHNLIVYDCMFPLIKNNKVFFGINKPEVYILPNGELMGIRVCEWYSSFKPNQDKPYLNTNLNFEDLKSVVYYDNFEALNIDNFNKIPMDYKGVMGVPITFLPKMNYNQFEILGQLNHKVEEKIYDFGKPLINGNYLYKRILIKKRE